MSNNTLKMGLGILAATLAIACTSPAEEAVADSPAAKADETKAPAKADDPLADIATARADRRTWVVYALDKPEDDHAGIGDAFRTLKAGANFKMKPLRRMRDRWGIIGNPNIDLTRGEAGLLCGQVTVASHTDNNKHLIVVEMKDADSLEYQLFKYDDSKTIEEQCVSGLPTHGGRAHAEN